MSAHPSLQNESDVEQKFIYSFLTAERGLGYSIAEVSTKARIRKLTIDKGQNLKAGYFPDYIVSIDGVPLLVVEAKGPATNLEEAYREARMYANEINALFPTGVNPVSFVLATNGHDLWVGRADCAAPTVHRVEFINEQFEVLPELRRQLSRDALLPIALNLKREIWPDRKYKPLRFMGATSRQSEEVEPNRFAKELIPYIRRYFDPDASRTRLDIVERGYVSTDQVTQYNEILEALLSDNIGNKKFKSFEQVVTSKNDAKAFNQALRDALARGPKTDSLLLLIGSVGAGKSMFIDRYYYLLMADDVRSSTYWANVDFNDAPSDLSNLDQWLAEQVLNDFKERNKITDFDHYENLLRYFNPEINRFRVGVGAQLYQHDRAEYERRLATKLDELTSNPVVFLQNVMRYYIGDSQKRVVIVFDNADKRDRDQQLIIFQEVQSFRSKHRVFSVLAMRDETYDRHKSEPPLDTYLAAFTFRISPPRFLDVVKRRLELIIEDLAENVEKRLSFQLPTGAVVRYPSTDLGNFLISFYQSLFHPRREIRLVLEALAGRNVRIALQMFSDILMSGHLSEDKIFISRASGGSVHLPERLILRILMRTKYQYYADGHGYISNLFFQPDDQLIGSPFGMVLILGALSDCRKRRGELGIEGYRLVSELSAEFMPQGMGEDEVSRVLNHLLNRALIQADHQRTDLVVGGDHVKITASGYFHLKLLISRFEYAVGLAGDIWYRDEQKARKVYELTQRNPGFATRRGSDRIKRVKLMISELRSELGILQQSSMVAQLDIVKESISAIEEGVSRFEAGATSQPQLSLPSNPRKPA